MEKCNCCGGNIPAEGSPEWEAGSGECQGHIGPNGECSGFVSGCSADCVEAEKPKALPTKSDHYDLEAFLAAYLAEADRLPAPPPPRRRTPGS